MATIVMGVGTSHTPQLSSGPQWWSGHAERDRANPFLVAPDGTVRSFDELASTVAGKLDDQLTMQVWEQKFQRGQDAVAALAKRLAEVQPDVIVVVGDDQRELFEDDVNPAIGLFLGTELVDQGLVPERVAHMPADIVPAQWAAHAEAADIYVTQRELSQHLAEELTLEGFDVGVFSQQATGRTLGHAFTFPRRRLGVPSSVPLVPVMVNAYYPPNVPTAARCWALGQALGRAVESWAVPARIALVASGGLTHFVVSEELDQQVLRALRASDAAAVASVPRLALRSGNSEILNWIVVGGALAGWTFDIVDYIPAYRSPAGTGVGMGFAIWTR